MDKYSRTITFHFASASMFFLILGRCQVLYQTFVLLLNPISRTNSVCIFFIERKNVRVVCLWIRFRSWGRLFSFIAAVRRLSGGDQVRCYCVIIICALGCWLVRNLSQHVCFPENEVRNTFSARQRFPFTPAVVSRATPFSSLPLNVIDFVIHTMGLGGEEMIAVNY